MAYQEPGPGSVAIAETMNQVYPILYHLPCLHCYCTCHMHTYALSLLCQTSQGLVLLAVLARPSFVIGNNILHDQALFVILIVGRNGC